MLWIVSPLSSLASTRWPQPRTLHKDSNRIGIFFLGASEEAKRPSVRFWADLCTELLGKGLRPVLFGGPMEQGMGQEVARLCKGPVLDMSGKLKLGGIDCCGAVFAALYYPGYRPHASGCMVGIKSTQPFHG